MRFNDGCDPEHGFRGAEYAKSLLNKEYEITEEQFELLYYACQYHNNKKMAEDKTIGTCWDADRLDLGRVCIQPSEDFLYSEEAKFIVKENKWKELTKFENKIEMSLMKFWKKWFC